MATEQVLLRLPEDLARRFRRAVPSRERSAFVERLLEEALLYRAALEITRDSALKAEMAEWETATLGDSLHGVDPLDHRAE